MARHVRWLTGAAAVVLVIARLTRLLQPTADGPSWLVVVAAMAVLGGVVTWISSAYRLSWPTITSINLLAALLATFRIVAPGTLAFGFLPTADTLGTFNEELGFAAEVFRFGAAPVIPIPGLIAALGVVCWGLGALVAVAAQTDRPWIGSIPPLVFYLQLSTLDRRSTTALWIGAFAVIATAAALASGPGSDRRTGRLRDQGGFMLPRRTPTVGGTVAALMVGAAVVGTTALAAAVPEAGSIDWRTRSGIGSGLYGQGSSFNLFVGLQQNLVELSDEPVFYARVSDSAPPNGELYWRLITLDVFDGSNWIPGAQSFARRGETRYEIEDWQFQGPTTEVSARVRIAELGQQVLPTLYSTTRLESDNPLIDDSFRVREDGSIGLDLRTREGWEYELRADVPNPDLDQLASLGGELSPIFAEATDAGAIDLVARPTEFSSRPEAVDPYLELSDEVSPAIRDAAVDITEPGVTRFEKALILEAFFRDSDNFVYSTDVTTGHSSLDLEDWLLDPESRNFRTGYCEQFATAMAVMARAIAIPSRVVLGFTPGDVVNQEDGSELIVVRERNAHAWVELWFDGQGWIRFDPTPRSDGVNASFGQSEVGFDARAFVPAPEDPTGLGNAGALPGERDPLLPDFDEGFGDATPDLRPDQGIAAPRWAWWLPALLGLGALAPLYKTIRRRRRLAAVASGNVEAAWLEITDRLRDLGVEVSSSETPLEIARKRDDAIVPLARMYGAKAYGGRPVGDSRRAFENADAVLSRGQRPVDKVKERVSLASLRRP